MHSQFLRMGTSKCCCFATAGTTPLRSSWASMCLPPSCIRNTGKTSALTSVANANRKRPKCLTGSHKEFEGLQTYLSAGQVVGVKNEGVVYIYGVSLRCPPLFRYPPTYPQGCHDPEPGAHRFCRLHRPAAAARLFDCKQNRAGLIERTHARRPLFACRKVCASRGIVGKCCFFVQSVKKHRNWRRICPFERHQILILLRSCYLAASLLRLSLPPNEILTSTGPVCFAS